MAISKSNRYSFRVLFCFITVFWSICLNAFAATGHVFHGHHREGQTDSVYGGAQPVSGSHVYLFAVSTSGYGATPISLLHGSGVVFDGAGNGYITTDSNGGFTIDDAYTSYCPTPDAQIYLQAVGGDPGTGTDNPAINLVTALKWTCSNLPNAPSVFIGETTTVAAVWALLPYSNFATSSFATSPLNISGLVSAFAYANSMVDSGNGGVLSTTPDGSEFVPFATINTMANLLAECVNMDTSSTCSSLFSAATPTGGLTPTNVLQAALNIAQNPTQNVSTIFNLLTSDQPFSPGLTSAPGDWNIGVGTPTTTTIAMPLPAGPGLAPAAINVHVSCNSACGLVDFRINGSEWNPVQLDQNGNFIAYFSPGTVWEYPLAIGQYSIQVYYLGNSSYQPSHPNPITAQITTPSVPTTTTITAITPVLPGASTSVTVHVNCNVACGYADYKLNGNEWGTVVLDGNGNFTAILSEEIAGPYTVQVYYLGDGTYEPSDSGPTIAQFGGTPTVPTSTVATVTPTTIIPNGGYTSVIAQVSCNTACGYVDYQLDGSEWGTVLLDNTGKFVAYTMTYWSPGLHNIVIYYRGNDTYMPSTSNSISVRILPGSDSASNTIYSYCIPGPSNSNCTSSSSGYAANGNIQAYTDSINGAWNNISYDALNRLTSATQTPVGSSAQYLCWGYDSFGNRKIQAISNQTFQTASPTCQAQSAANVTQVSANYDDGTNRVTGNPSVAYDATGNITYDGINSYAYDAEGRVCAVASSPITGLIAITQYLYDAEGRRVAKGTAHTVLANGQYIMSCDTTINGYSETAGYVLGPNGEQVTEMDGSGNWVHTNVYAAGQLIATYDVPGIHFHLADWLGSRRVQTDYAGNVEQTYQNLPFGEFVPSNTSPNLGATEQHFTGKERDNESRLDYFGARYYTSSIGRLMSPDDGSDQSSDNPQSWNLFSYVRNNPIKNTDPTGNACVNGVDDDRGGETCADVAAADAWYQQQGLASITVTADVSIKDPGIIPGDLGLGLYAGGALGDLAFNGLLRAGGFLLGTGTTVAEGVVADTATTALRGGLAPVLKGKAGEAAVRAIENIGSKRTILIAGRARIPDGLTETTLNEVKNVFSLSLTQQLKDDIAYAADHSLKFQLWVRPSTILSPPLKNAIAAGQIIPRYF